MFKKNKTINTNIYLWKTSNGFSKTNEIAYGGTISAVPNGKRTFVGAENKCLCYPGSSCTFFQHSFSFHLAFSLLLIWLIICVLMWNTGNSQMSLWQWASEIFSESCLCQPCLLTIVMRKMCSEVLLLLTAWATQLNSAAMLPTHLTVSSVWRCTMDKISSYWSLETSSSWDISSSSTCSSRTLGHSLEKRKYEPWCLKGLTGQEEYILREEVLHL